MKRHMMIFALLAGALLLSFSGPKVSTAQVGTTIEISRLDFENADIRQVMKTLGEIGGRNIILDHEITGEVTIYLREITWESALLAVLNMRDLVGYEENGFIKILTREDYETQINTLRDQERQRYVEERLAEPKQVKVIKINHADAAIIKTTIDPLLGEGDQPSVDRRTNSLVFTVTDSSLVVIEDIIKELDTETRQVSIEVKMVTVNSSSLSELGVNWSALKNDNSAELNTVSEAGKLFVGKFTGTISNTALNAAIASLIDQNKAEVVSRPHVTTQDNETATISSGQQIPFLSYDEARNVVTEMIDASTELNVTPHILTDERILLDVIAARRSGEAVGFGVTVNEERAEVRMITSNGETAVIGGLRHMRDSKHDMGIPVLQNIPLIGQLFKYTRIENSKTDLIIFITPHIVERIDAQLTE
ncbi:hypothetical protein ACFL47_10295 [Candidatus Latescibacterota bacterium]